MSNGGASRNVTLVDPGQGGKKLKPQYDNSWAVVIGINGYSSGITPLNYAVQDADGFARLLVSDLGFKPEQVFVILDPPSAAPDAPYTVAAQRATKDDIEHLLEDDLPEKTGPDDRLLIFFAGHGERRSLPSGEQEGYLVPADAKPGRWSTYILTDDVTKVGDRCRAKHVFYLFDACYSGLAVTRAVTEPSPYEQTMLTNKARMALTAGTAKEAVNDKGPGGHSPFTWYVLQGLRGEARQKGSGVVTGSDLMVYVKNAVGQNYGSQQTPDYGKLPGHESGGDFIFRLPATKPVLDLSQWVTVRDTGAEPTAAAAAAVTAVETVLARRGQQVQLSIKALYDRAKQHDETDASSSGTWLNAIVYVAEQFGIAVEGRAAAPGRPASPRGRQPRATPDGSDVVHPRFFRLAGLDEIPEQLARGRPIIAACRIYASWFRDANVAKTGMLLPPRAKDQLEGISVVTVVRFDPNDASYRAAFNWGTGWGDAGFATLSAEVAQALLVPEMLWAVDLPGSTPAELSMRR